jgi:hypothetical protein
MTIRILINDAALTYAARECRKFLLEYTAADVTETDGNADKTVRLTVDGALAPHRYSLCGDGDTLSVAGGSPSAVQCGLYAALSEAGVLFEATGYSLPGAWDTAAFFGTRRDVSPKFRHRGIRQHINFPMDISSYSLDDAKEYIRSIARMGMNAITFHS